MSELEVPVEAFGLIRMRPWSHTVVLVVPKQPFQAGSVSPNSVDRNEDAKASEFQTVQPSSTGSPQLLETEGIENSPFARLAGNLPWAQGVGRSNRPAPTNRIKKMQPPFRRPQNRM